MTKFNVTVITADKPNPTLLKKTLQPWHEYESTGCDDEYVTEVEVTDEIKDEWAQATITAFRLHDGKICEQDVYLDILDDLGLESNQLDSAVELKMRPCELAQHTGETIEEFARKYYNALERNGRFYRRTNLNAKWDYWGVGRGRLKAIKNADVVVSKAIYPASPNSVNGVDSCRICDLDLDAMRIHAQEKRQDAWNQVLKRAKDQGLSFTPTQIEAMRAEVNESWDRRHEKTRANPDLDRDAHRRLHAPEASIKLRDVFFTLQGIRVPMNDTPIAEWITAAPLLSTSALVKDGKWFEIGRIGWFAIVTEAMRQDEWQQKFDALLNEAPRRHWITVVDCHI